jgi:transcriptional regulator with XRE-family HTH domain
METETHKTLPCPRCGTPDQVIAPDWLRRQRERAGISLRALAKTVGMSAAYLSQIERGYKPCTRKLAAVYETVGDVDVP